jgi:hypothetical protein
VIGVAGRVLVLDSTAWGKSLVIASGRGFIGLSIGGMNLEGGVGVCADGLVTRGVVDDEGVISRGNGDKYEICSTGGEEDWGSGRSE